MISGLPSRPTSEGKADSAVFLLSLDGVTRWGLMAAIEGIVKGSLGHAFMPSPPELRLAIDQTMLPHIEARAQAIRREKLEAETAEFGPIPERTPEQIARVASAYERFCAGYDVAKDENLEEERAETRARYGMTDKLLAKIPDRPLPGFRKLGE